MAQPTEPVVTPGPVPGFHIRLIGSALFTGYAPIASGTVGSALALLIYMIPGFESPYIMMTALSIVFIGGTYVADRMEAYYGHDPAEVTIDEVVGMWFSLLLLPKEPFIFITGFFLFRFFDIIKPYPARKFDRMTGGFGIMMDDVIAGLYTNILLHAIAAVRLFTGL